jgi:PPK2 family polyphosphate:nucleotide phosphotransferase
MDFRSRYGVKPRSQFVLRQVDTKDTGELRGKTEAELLMVQSRQQLSTAQELLYAQRQWALLVILQALDAAGKDGTIKHVMSGVNPTGCQVTSFVGPTKQELYHDYLWRHVRELPERGCIGIHNRSHYEEVIVTQVHPSILANQALPDEVRSPDLIRRRYREINRFERYLTDNGTVVLKFFLHLSKREQWRRLRDRMETPEKYWKLRASDLKERLHWEKYMDVYQDVFRHTSTRHARWYVIPADNKWFARLAVAQIINETLAGLKLHYPDVTPEMREEWEKARELLRNA